MEDVKQNDLIFHDEPSQTNKRRNVLSWIGVAIFIFFITFYDSGTSEQSTVEQLQDRVSDLESRLGAVQRRNYNLQLKIENLEWEVSSLESDVKSLESER